MRVLPSTVTSRGSSAWPSGIDTVSWLSTLPSIPASGDAVLLQQMERLDVEHLQRQGQRPLSAEGDPPRARQRLRHVDREGALEGELAAVGNGEGGVRNGHLEGAGRRGARARGAPRARASCRRGRTRDWPPRASASRARGRCWPPSRCRRRSPRRAGTCRPGSSRAPVACTTQSRACGASGAGHSVLKMLAGIGPILPSRWACMTPAMSVTSPSAETSAPPARSLNWLSTTRPRSGEKNPRADQSSRSQALAAEAARPRSSLRPS